MLHSGRVEGRALAPLVIPRELQIVALAGHPHGQPSNPRPSVEVQAEGVEDAVVRGQGARGESEGCHQQPAALFSHGPLCATRR